MNKITPYSYKLATGMGLDSDVGEGVVDVNTMSWTGILACTSVDRIGDVLEVDGIDFTNHMKNPVAMLDHGLNYKLPIGKTEDQNGNYKVWVDGENCYQTTYFSQSSEMAEQVFALLNEKILRACSIGYKATNQTPIRMKNGQTRGMHIKACELVESSIVGIPCNQDAVMACYHNDKISGKQLLPQIKSLLQPYIIPVKPIFNGVNTKDNKMADEVENEKMPLGQEALVNLSKSLKDMHEVHSEAMELCENEKVKKAVMKHLDAIKEMADNMDALHEKHYGEDEDQVDAEESKEMDNEEDGNSSSDENVVAEEDDEKAYKDMAFKAFLEAMTKFFKESAKETKQVVVEETLSAEDMKKAAALERKLARIEQMLNR